MKRMNFKWIFGIGLAVGISTTFLTGCLQNDWEDCEKQSKKEFDKYLTDHNISVEYKKESGLYYIPDTIGTGLAPEGNDYIVINYTGWYVDGTMLETTDSTMKANWTAAVELTDFVYGSTKLMFGISRPGFNEGLSYMKEGGWSTLIMPTELAYYDCRSVVYKINLISVIKNPVEYEKAMVLQCLADNDMDTLSSFYRNIYYKELVTSADTHSVELTDTVLIRFTGKYTYKTHNDPTVKFRVFDSNTNDSKPLKIVYGKNNVYYGGSVLAMPEGFISALDTMCKGTRAIAILPYTQAFGETGLDDINKGYSIVPDYQTVIYNLYVEDIIPKAAKK
jgi:FKBP-type peptidyl-prolyl cis-trans isomerase